MTSSIEEPRPRFGERRISAVVDLVTMALIAALGLWVVVTSVGLGLQTSLGIGPGMFPLASGAALLLLGLIGVVSRAIRLRGALAAQPDPAVESEPDAAVITEEEPPPSEAETFTTVKWGRLAIAAALVFAFVLVMGYLGFVISLSLFMLAMMLLVARRSWWVSLIVAVATAAAIYFGFGVFLGVVLPGPTAPFLSWMNP